MKNCDPSLVKNLAPFTEIVGKPPVALPCARIERNSSDSTKRRRNMAENFMQNLQLLLFNGSSVKLDS